MDAEKLREELLAVIVGDATGVAPAGGGKKKKSGKRRPPGESSSTATAPPPDAAPEPPRAPRSAERPPSKKQRAQSESEAPSGKGKAILLQRPPAEETGSVSVMVRINNDWEPHTKGVALSLYRGLQLPKCQEAFASLPGTEAADLVLGDFLRSSSAVLRMRDELASFPQRLKAERDRERERVAGEMGTLQKALAEAKAAAKSSLRRVSELEEQLSSAESSKASEIAVARDSAVAEFKSSAEFQRAIVDASKPAFEIGWDETLKKVEKIYPDIRAVGLSLNSKGPLVDEEEEDDEDESSEEEEEADKGTAGRGADGSPGAAGGESGGGTAEAGRVGDLGRALALSDGDLRILDE